VDSAGKFVLTESWNGSSWSVSRASGGSGTINQLNGVSCSQANRCTAVGYSMTRSFKETLVEAWNGRRWSEVESSDPSSSDNILNAVSCSDPETCTGVGLAKNRSGAVRTLIEASGSSGWSTDRSPNQRVISVDNLLNGVSCTSATSCEGIGNWGSGSGALAESWNGASWSNSRVANPARKSNVLRAVSCASATDCEAVGYGFDVALNVTQTVIETWNGSSWSVAPSPNETGDSRLFGVSCATSTSCIAVGDYLNSSGALRTLVESWNGESWSIIPSANRSSKMDNELNGVTCTSATSCVAVGSDNDDSSLVESYDGSGWTLASSPNPGTPTTLSGVSCISSLNCEAVGSYVNGSDVQQTLVELWNGSNWSVTSSPDAGEGANELLGVSCIASTDCVAVGDASGGTLVESLNGSAWSVTASPDEGTSNSLTGVSCTSSTNCVAVGSFADDSDVSQTLSEIGTVPVMPKPTVSGFSPKKGAPGRTVTIRGTNLENVSSVTFHGAQATILSETATRIKVTVPAGARTGRIRVVAPGGKAKSANKFIVT
jgi:hypothetical protein